MKKQTAVYSFIILILGLTVGVLHSYNALPSGTSSMKGFSSQLINTTPVILVAPTPGSYTNLESLSVANESATMTDVVLACGSFAVTMPIGISGQSWSPHAVLYAPSAGSTWIINTTVASVTIDVGGQYYQVTQ